MASQWKLSSKDSDIIEEKVILCGLLAESLCYVFWGIVR
jgi:hypothetical protein